MERDPILTLIGLAVVAVFALGAVLLLLRVGRPPARSGPGVVGYPADLFPRRELVTAGPLAELSAAQARLLAVYRELPPRGEAAVWLAAFLGELRAIMDAAYRVAGVAAIYGDTSLLERVVAEVQQAERQIAEQAMQQMLRGDEFADEQLDARLAVLRRYANQLAGG